MKLNAVISVNGHNPHSVSNPNIVGQVKYLLRLAETRAERLQQQAENQAKQTYKAAYEEGYKKGQLEAANILLEAHYARRNLMQNAKQQILTLAYEIAEQVVGVTIENNPRALLKRIERALAQNLHASSIKILLNPNDQLKVDQLPTEYNKGQIKFIPDESILAGEVRIEADSISVEVSYRQHLKLLRQSLLKSQATE